MRYFLLALVATVTLAVYGQSNENEGDQPAKGQTVILGTWAWDIETDQQGSMNGRRADVWWEQVTEKEQFLVPLNGAGLVLLSDKVFEMITQEDLATLKYSYNSVANESLASGAVVALKTEKGNFAKLKVVKYRELHDFSFPEAKHMSAGWKAFVLKKPNRENYHLEVEWELYQK